MPVNLKDALSDRYVICSCEGTAEKAIIDLLLDQNKLCFQRSDLVGEECTKLRTGRDITNEFLTKEYERNIAIVRILDREKERFILPKCYNLNKNIQVFNVVTKPEIEILHIHAEELFANYQHELVHNKQLKPSEFCKIKLKKLINVTDIKVKSVDFIHSMYANDIEKLIDAMNKITDRPKNCYLLKDLLV